MRVFFSNLGCKLNQAELEALSREFAAAGHEVVGALGEADLHVVNSCTVTAGAARDSRKLARRGSRLGRGVRTVLTGCYVASDPDDAAALAGVDLVVPNERKAELLDAVHRAFPDEVPPPTAAIPCAPAAFGNARALVKVEDGCNMSCAFCIIPSTRGDQRSRPAGEIVAEVRELAGHGFQEVIVTGVQISSYRHAGMGLFDLVERVLGETEVRRLRLSSIAPWQFDRRLLELFEPTGPAAGRVCRHFHLSLQSGSTPTLQRMRRPYSASAFAELVAEIRDAVPGVAITTDVIVGFPGETDTEFDESLDFVRRIGFSRVHAFPFSPRPGTEAASLPGRVEHTVQRARMKRMLAVGEKSELAFHAQHVGAPAEVLWERRRRDGLWWGTSDNYLRVAALSDDELAQQLRQTRLEELISGGPIAVRAESAGAARGVTTTIA